jgi:DNA polymerase-3 subunit delta
MKLTGRDALAYFRRPDTGHAGVLVYGSDAMRVALRRQELVGALVGPEGDKEMRLTRLAAADLRKDGSLVLDAIKAQGFFPGPRVVLVEDATDGLSGLIGEALTDWHPADAQIVVTAGSLNARSSLRKLFEGRRDAVAIGIYDDPPSQEEIQTIAKTAGLGAVAPDAMSDLVALARLLGPGDFRQVVEKIVLYKIGDPDPLTGTEVLACAPAFADADIDDVLNCVAEARDREVGTIMQRLASQGVQPVALCIGATRHFRALHAAASAPGGAAAGIARLRPPVFGPRRDQMVRQAQNWGVTRLETALRLLTDTDLSLRSSQRAPQMALMERTLIRIAMLGKR